MATMAVGACGDGGVQQPPNLGPPAIELVYQGTSDKRPLLECHLHSTSDNYKSTPNLLAEPLGREERIVIEGFTPATYYLTVMRLHQSHAGLSEVIAVTTAEPVEFRSGRFVVWVFDKSFRVYDPVKNN